MPCLFIVYIGAVADLSPIVWLSGGVHNAGGLRVSWAGERQICGDSIVRRSEIAAVP